MAELSFTAQSKNSSTLAMVIVIRRSLSARNLVIVVGCYIAPLGHLGIPFANMSTNNIQYSDKYYDDVYEYR